MKQESLTLCEESTLRRPTAVTGADQAFRWDRASMPWDHEERVLEENDVTHAEWAVLITAGYSIPFPRERFIPQAVWEHNQGDPCEDVNGATVAAAIESCLARGWVAVTEEGHVERDRDVLGEYTGEVTGYPKDGIVLTDLGHDILVGVRCICWRSAGWPATTVPSVGITSMPERSVMTTNSGQRLTTFQTVAPFAVAAACLSLATMQWFLRPDLSRAEHVLFSILGVVLVFDLPICFFILIGHPPVMTLSPLFPSKEERAFHRSLRMRPELSDDEFVAKFYAGTNVPPDVPVRLRRELEATLDLELASIHPQDNIAHADDELDFADVVFLIERTFQITIPFDEFCGESDGTFDSLVRCICRRRQER